jgi:hypothetical protein
MSGYLERLAARAAGAPSAAGPRLPSHFEQGGAGSGLGMQQAVPPGGGRANAPEYRPDESGRMPRSRSEEPAHEADDTSGTGSTATRAREPDSQPVSPVREKPAARTSATAPRATTPEPAESPSRRGSRGRRSDRLVDVSSGERIIVAARPAEQGAPGRTGTSGPAEGSRQSRQSPSGTTPAAPDVVHVSIGRVEVRATLEAPPEASAPAPSRREPAVSLQDYLDGRRSR